MCHNSLVAIMTHPHLLPIRIIPIIGYQLLASRRLISSVTSAIEILESPLTSAQMGHPLLLLPKSMLISSVTSAMFTFSQGHLLKIAPITLGAVSEDRLHFIHKRSLGLKILHRVELFGNACNETIDVIALLIGTECSCCSIA